MSTSRLLLSLPDERERLLSVPHMAALPDPAGRKLPNGMIVVTDERFPDSFFKFTPWKSASLAFNEVEIYARIAASADPTGVVKLQGVAGTKDHFVRVMERSHRGALDRFLIATAEGDAGRIDSRFARSILLGVARTMAELHRMNLIHRDLKAENILIFGDDASIRPKVSDFDRAVELLPTEQLEKPVGSLFHMAPELLAWEPYGRAVDVYAFGILMFEVAHGGARPHTNVGTFMPDSITQADFAKQVVVDHLRPRWLHDDEGLKELAAACWNANAEERPGFDEIVEQLMKSDAPRSTARQGDGVTPSPVMEDDAPSAIGAASHIGRVRRTMEDALAVAQAPGTVVAGVFDGFRGHQVSQSAAWRLPLVVSRALEQGQDDLASSVQASFSALSAELKAAEVLECGSTATIAAVSASELLVAWVGDSPAYLFREHTPGEPCSAIALINKHHPGREDEAAGIKARGGIVDREKRWMDSGEEVPWGPLRVFIPDGKQRGGVALSRALGFFAFKPAIGDEPEMLQLTREASDRFLVLGSDGIFDILDAGKIADILHATPVPQQAADVILKTVLNAGAPDNASVIVIDLQRL